MNEDECKKLKLLALLEEMEMDGTLLDWVKEHYPEMILPDGSVAKFSLSVYLGLI